MSLGVSSRPKQPWPTSRHKARPVTTRVRAYEPLTSGKCPRRPYWRSRARWSQLLRGRSLIGPSYSVSTSTSPYSCRIKGWKRRLSVLTCRLQSPKRPRLATIRLCTVTLRVNSPPLFSGAPKKNRIPINCGTRRNGLYQAIKTWSSNLNGPSSELKPSMISLTTRKR